MSARDFFNAGTRRLKASKLREAENLLETALGTQDDHVRSPALFNLGHVRFAQGLEELKKNPDGQSAANRARSAVQQADAAISSAADALKQPDVARMVAAYMQGRGARKELTAATKAVKKAMEVYGTVLNKWQRASGDFKGALELNPRDQESAQNAQIVDQCIARLVDSIREMQALANAMGQKKQQLGEKMDQLKGQIPAPDMPPGAAGDDEEEEEQPSPTEHQGKEEGPSREGKEMALSPEEAGWLLEGYKLDNERKLPMGPAEPAQPQDRNKPTW